MKKILALVILIFVISSCWGEQSITELENKKAELEKQLNDVKNSIKNSQTWAIEKQDFFIETKKLSAFDGSYEIKKNWKINSTQNITLSSNSAWRVSQILVNEWTNVKAWQLLATLEDNIWSYWINLSRAQNSLERARINYTSTELNLDKAIFDSELNLNKLKDNLVALEKDKQEALKQVAIQLEDSNYQSTDSKSSLEVEKLNNTIKKLELDYSTKWIADEKTINWFIQSLKKDHSSLLLTINDVIEFSDVILWVTPENKDKNDKFEDFLWAKDKNQKNITESNLRDLIIFKSSKFTPMNLNSDSEEVFLDNLEIIEEGYDKTMELLSNLEKTLNNSVESVWTLWATEIWTYVWNINVYQSTLQGNYSWFVASSNNSKSFIKTYLLNYQSLLKQIDLLKIDKEILEKSLSTGNLSAEINYQKTLISYNDRIVSLESQVKMAEKWLENANSSKSITLRSLNNAISEAQIWLRSSQKEYSKLSVLSPITWVVWEVLIDIWEEVWVGKQLFSVVNKNIPKVKISFDKSELSDLSLWDKAFTILDSKTLTWTLVSLSSIADENLKYTWVVVFDTKADLIWNIIEVTFKLETDKTLVPLNIVSIWNISTSWTLRRYNLADKIDSFDVTLWDVFWKKIEILDLLYDEKWVLIEDYDIILNDVTQFDGEKFKWIIK